MDHYEPEKLSTEQLLIARRICARDLAALDAEIQQRLVRTEDNRQAEAAAKELIAGRSRDTEEAIRIACQRALPWNQPATPEEEAIAEAIMQAREQGPPRPWAVIHVPPITEYTIRGQRFMRQGGRDYAVGGGGASGSGTAGAAGVVGCAGGAGIQTGRKFGGY